MKLFLLLVLLVTLVAIGESIPNDSAKPSSPDTSLDEEWEKFKIKFKRHYKDAQEEQYRKKIFAKHLKEIREHNKKYAAGEVSYEEGINQFSDRADNELNLGLMPVRA